MCESCRAKAIALAESALPEDRVFWRDLTPTELEFGDIPRVVSDIDSAELDIVQSARPAMKGVVRDLVTQAAAAIKARDMKAITGIDADKGELAKAIKDASGRALDAGKRQVFDEYRRQTGHKLSLPPKKRPRLTANYLATKSEVLADLAVRRAAGAAQKAAISQIARETVDAETLEKLIETAASESLIASATEAARESVAIGRSLAMLDTEAEIETVVYTAIMDQDVCEECMAADGEEYDNLEAAPDVPNPDCIGEEYGNTCRCNLVVIYKKG